MRKRKRKIFMVISLVTALVLTSLAGIHPLSVKAAGSIYWPVPGHTSLSQGLHDNNAIDISDGSIAGATVIAALGGTVTYIHRCGQQHSGSYHTCNGFGTGLVIHGTDGRNYQYAHMQAGSIPSNIQKGSTVNSGQEIGKVGKTGNATGNHLHFGVCYGNYWEASGNPLAENYIYSGSSTVVPSSPNVSFADFNQNAVWETNAEMYIKIQNPDRATVSAVGCYLYNENGGLVKSYSEQCSYKTTYVNYNCNINNDMKYTLQKGTTYKFVLYAIVDGKEYRDIMRTFKTKGSSDSVKPVISDVSVYDITESGYKIKCKATDNVGVDRVQFPTWTTANDQDDIQPDWGINSAASGRLDASGYYIYEVRISDHKNELGDYNTHIYAYDKAGNHVCYVVPAVTLKKTVTPPPSGSQSTQKADGAALAAVAEQEYAAYHGQQYNYQYGTSPWCCNFVSWCARQAGISADVMKSTATVQTMYDNLINACGAKVVTSPQRGDLVFYKYTNYDPERFHHIGIMSSATETVQGNVNNTWWKGKPDALAYIKQMVYVRPAYNGEYVASSSAYFADYNLNKTEDNNAEVYIKIQNPNRGKVTAVGCELYDKNGILLKTYSEECSYTTSYVNYTCNFNSDMGYTLSSGTTYNFKLYAVVDGKRMNDSMRTFTTTGITHDAEQGKTEEYMPTIKDTQNSTATTKPQTNTNNNINANTNTNTEKPKTTVTSDTRKKPGKKAKKPGKVKGLALSSYSRKIRASWKSDRSANRTGYQIQYARNKSFTNKKKSKKMGYYTTSIVLKKLKKGKYYYVRIRAVNRVGKVTKYGKWSKTKKIKIK